MAGKFTRTAAIVRAKELARKNGHGYVVINDNHYDHDLPAKWIAIAYEAWAYGTDTAPYYCHVSQDGEISFDNE